MRDIASGASENLSLFTPHLSISFMVDASFTLKDLHALPADRKIQRGWFGIAHEWFPDNDNDQRSLGSTREAYGTLCKIESADGEAIYRVVRSAGTGHIGHESNGGDNEILLDYKGRIDLVGDPSEADRVELKIRPATPCESVFFLFDHPDPAYSAARLPTIVAVVLSVIGITLAALPPSWHSIPAIVLGIGVIGGGLWLFRVCR